MVEALGAMMDSVPQISAILTEMIEAARRSGAPGLARNQPIQCRLGTFELRGVSSFKVAHPEVRSVWSCKLMRLDPSQELGSIILKTVFRNRTPGVPIGPPREAKFYANLGERAALADFRIPKLYAINIQDDGAIQIFIELLDDLAAIPSHTELYRAAEVLGRFSGHCHLAKLYAAEWLPRGRLIPQVHNMTCFEQLMAWLPYADDERAEIFDSYQQVLGRIGDLDAIYDSEMPTVCHGDLNHRNLLLRGHGFAALDWETVNAGRIGDDLGELALRLLREKEPGGGDDDERLFAAYLAGVSPFLPRDASQSIRRVFRLRLIIESTGEIDTHWRWMRNARDGATRRQRMNILAQTHRRMAQRARELLRELGG